MPRPSLIASEAIAPYTAESGARSVRLFRNGANQALRIPKEFELPGNEALIRREGNRLIIEPVKAEARTLAEAMEGWEDIDEPFPDVDQGLLPLDDVRL